MANIFQCSAWYSCVENGATGTGNIDITPLFVDPNNGDYHLKSEGWRWEHDRGRWEYDDVTSPCIDGGDPAVNPSAEPAPNGGRINMGAYGQTQQASMSEWPLKHDSNRDAKVNLADFAKLANEWLDSLPWAE